MRTFRLLIPIASTLTLTLALPAAQAKVSQAEADRLGKDLTCVGAEVAGNKEGTIPPFTGKWLGTPPNLSYTLHVGQHPVDVYRDEKPLFSITAQNMGKYAEHLTEGQKAMFAKYPQTFRIPVYPGHRDFRYPDKICELAKKNALEASLIDDGLGFTGYMGPVPFPIPKNAMEVLTNHNFPYRAFTELTKRDNADVSSDGSVSWGQAINHNLNIVTSPGNLGNPMGGNMAYTRNETLLPEREKGIINVSQEPVNFARGKRLAWSYDPGTRRVRQLPEYGFDTPLNGTGGKLTIDEDRLFNGSPERYKWSLIGKREIYIPANAFRIHGKDVKYADLLKRNHENPDYMRYELRRVWVIQGELKEGYRHIFAKRVMYLDEDTWHAVISDHYDGRGSLWQHAFINYYYAFDLNAWHSGASFYHDLNSGAYFAYNLWQEQPVAPILNKGGLEPGMFTPAALRAAGK